MVRGHQAAWVAHNGDPDNIALNLPETCTEDGNPADALMRAMFEDAREVLLSLCNEIAQLGQLHAQLSVREATDIVMAFMCGHYECVLRHPETYAADRDWAPLVDAALRGLIDEAASVALRRHAAMDTPDTAVVE